MLCDLAVKHNLSQVVKVPTHSSGNMLDLVLTNSPDKDSNLSTTPSYFDMKSDPYLVTFSVQACTKRLSNPTRSIYSFNRMNMLEIDLVLMNTNFNLCDDIELPNGASQGINANEVNCG